jgi:hypothetical protein
MVDSSLMCATPTSARGDSAASRLSNAKSSTSRCVLLSDSNDDSKEVSRH